jgi:hypothetical protein
MTKEPTKTPDQRAGGKPANKTMTPAEAQAAADAEAYNRQQTGGYDQSKGPEGRNQHRAKSVPDVTEDEIREAIEGVIEGWRGRASKDSVVNVLRAQAELVFRSGDWVRDPSTLDYDPDDLDDPRANPLGVRPSPPGATRADEETAPEPDSRGNIADRLAAKSGLSVEEIDDADVPPSDRDAVAAKRGAEKAAAEYGTAGGTPLARAEHKDDPKKRR